MDHTTHIILGSYFDPLKSKLLKRTRYPYDFTTCLLSFLILEIVIHLLFSDQRALFKIMEECDAFDLKEKRGCWSTARINELPYYLQIPQTHQRSSWHIYVNDTYAY